MLKYLKSRICKSNAYKYQFKEHHDDFFDTDFMYMVTKNKDGKFIWIAGIEYQLITGSDYSELRLSGVAINEEYQGRGIMSKFFGNMLVEILNKIAPLQVNRISILVKCNNISMIKLATSYNFKPCGLRLDPDNKTNPEPYIELELSRLNKHYQDEATRGVIENVFNNINGD